MPIKTFKHKDNEALESKVNDWLSYNDSDFEIKDIKFKLGREDNKPCHYAYIWYENKHKK